jgi:hypothetical protein
MYEFSVSISLRRRIRGSRAGFLVKNREALPSKHQIILQMDV